MTATLRTRVNHAILILKDTVANSPEQQPLNSVTTTKGGSPLLVPVPHMIWEDTPSIYATLKNFTRF